MAKKSDSGVVYVWTDKMEKWSKGKFKAGQEAHLWGKPIVSKLDANAWVKNGYIAEKTVAQSLMEVYNGNRGRF